MLSKENRELLDKCHVSVRESVPSMVMNNQAINLTGIIFDNLRMKMADYIVKENVHRQVDGYAVIFGIDLIVATPDTFYKLAQDCAMDLLRFRPLPPMETQPPKHIKPYQVEERFLFNVPRLPTKEMLTALSQADDDNDAVQRILNILRKQ
jgi:hypothetical protein